MSFFYCSFFGIYFNFLEKSVVKLFKLILPKNWFNYIDNKLFDFLTSKVLFFEFSYELCLIWLILTVFAIKLFRSFLQVEIKAFVKIIVNVFFSIIRFIENLTTEKYNSFFFQSFKIINFFNIKKILLGTGFFLNFLFLLFFLDLSIEKYFIEEPLFLIENDNLYNVSLVNINFMFNFGHLNFYLIIFIFYFYLHSILGIYSILYDYLPNNAFLIFISYLTFSINLIFGLFFLFF